MLLGISTRVASVVLASLSVSPLADVFVDQNAANCAAGNGSAANPVCSIAAAVSLAAAGDTIRIAPGTYVENLLLSKDLELIGTGGVEVTIIDGAQSGSVVEIPVAVTVTLDGLTLTNGRADRGGGAVVEGHLVLKNSTITLNEATGNPAHGGGLSAFGATSVVTIESSVVSNNSCDNEHYPDSPSSFGGGVSVVDGQLSLLSSEVSGNSCVTHSDNGTLARSSGGGVSVMNGQVAVQNSTISANECRVAGQAYYGVFSYGGGLSVSGSDLVLQSSTISSNSAYAYPGDTPGGYGGGYGGGISSMNGLMNITNSTISLNTAYASGGVDCRLPSVGSTLENSTITLNATSTNFGGSINSETGGLAIESTYPAINVEVRNTILAGNTARYGWPDARGDLLSLGHNLVGAGSLAVWSASGDLVGSLTTPLEAHLDVLQNNGGETETHALLPLSLALDAGDALVFSPFDQRGVARPSGAGPDIGAYERSGPSPTPSVCNGDGGDQMGCTDCPCGNNATPGSLGGCLNSAGTSTRLTVGGDLSVSLPPMSENDLRFGLVGAPGGVLSLLLSGDGVASNNMANPCFGLSSGVQFTGFDGLRCAIQNLRRHGGRVTDFAGQVALGGNPWGGLGGPPVGIAQAGGGFASGQTRYFQVIHRDDPLASCMTGLNSSQAVRVTFQP